MIDNQKNVHFWDKAALKHTNRSAPYAGMLMEGRGREFEVIYRLNAEHEHLSKLFNCLPSSRVLEVGSGGGRWAIFFADRIATYVGLDISPKMVELAEAECGRRRLTNTQFSCTSLIDYNNADQFDLIYFSSVLQYMDDDVVAATIAKAP